MNGTKTSVTYKELKKILDKLNEEQLEQNATIFINGEYYPINDIRIIKHDDVLDKGHIYLCCFS